jgi:hypothetical protein
MADVVWILHVDDDTGHESKKVRKPSYFPLEKQRPHERHVPFFSRSERCVSSFAGYGVYGVGVDEA